VVGVFVSVGVYVGKSVTKLGIYVGLSDGDIVGSAIRYNNL
jgi:hypothetical protein